MSPNKIISPVATVPAVASAGEITSVELNAPEVAVVPPDNPEVLPVVIVTPVMSHQYKKPS